MIHHGHSLALATSVVIAVAASTACSAPDVPGGPTPQVGSSGGTTGPVASSGGITGSAPQRDSESIPTGPELPEGCGDGIVTPGQYCFIAMTLPDIPPEHAKVGSAVGLDLWGDARDEFVFDYLGRDNHSLGLQGEEWIVGPAVEGAMDLRKGFAWDWTGNGRLDVVIPYDSETSKVTVIPNMGDAIGPAQIVQVAPDSEYGAGQYPVPIDVDADGQLEFLIAVELPVSERGAHLRRFDGEQWVKASETFPLPGCGAFGAWAHGDFNGDGYTDVVTHDSVTWCKPYPYEYDREFHRVAVFLSEPETGQVTLAGTFATGRLGLKGIWADDFDEDGRTDVLISGGDRSGASLLRGQGNGTLLDPLEISEIEGTSVFWNLGQRADFDGDGDLEFTGGEGANGRMWIAEDIGVGGVGGHIVPLFDENIGAKAVADLNGDGAADFFEGAPKHSSEMRVFISAP